MSDMLETENKRLVKEGRLKSVSPSRRGSKVSHKPKVPKTSKTWSLNSADYALLRFGFFWELIK